MSKVDAPRHDPVPIGEVAAPPFCRLPEPISLFADRTHRLRRLAQGHALAPYLTFLADLTEAQYRIQDDLPFPEIPETDARRRAREFHMPPLDRNRFTVDRAYDAALVRLLALAVAIEMPATAGDALKRVIAADAGTRETMMHALLADTVPVDEGACPACGGPPVASMVVGWKGAHGTRFCSCALCGTLWHVVRIKCTLCGSTKGIGYQEIEGAPVVKAETCDECRGYVKILHQHKEVDVDPIADDVASLGLDLLVREKGYRRGAFK